MRAPWLCVSVLAACGSSNNSTVDSAPVIPDATEVPDAGSPDAPPPPPDASPPDASAPDATPLLPDLVLIGEEAANSLYLEQEFFSPDACEAAEACIGGPGLRTLLKFTTLTANMGTADLEVGMPDFSHPLFEYSECHDHFHFQNYATYELVSPAGVVASGRKQAFCLEDTDQLDPSKPGSGYTCEYQGISMGWSDRYSSVLPCQWIDVTDVLPGDYMLRIRVNYEHILPELDYTNNEATIPVHLE